MILFGIIEIRLINLKAQIKELVRKEEYILAIKLYREKTGKGLRDSKAYVDKIRHKMGIFFPHEMRKG